MSKKEISDTDEDYDEPVLDDEEPEEENDEEENEEEDEPEEENDEEGDELDEVIEENNEEEEYGNQELNMDFDNGGDDSFVFEDNKRKKATRRKVTKKKLFPFIQKKKYNHEVEKTEDSYLGMNATDSSSESLNIRKTTIDFLIKYTSSSGKSLNEKEPPIFEKAIYESSFVCGQFNKQLYVEHIRYFMGAFESLKKHDIINEIRNKSAGWNSVLFKSAADHEKIELNKLLNPLEASDNPDYPCPRCKSTKSYKSIKNVRSGDEGASALFLCGNRSCGFRWKING